MIPDEQYENPLEVDVPVWKIALNVFLCLMIGLGCVSGIMIVLGLVKQGLID